MDIWHFLNTDIIRPATLTSPEPEGFYWIDADRSELNDILKKIQAWRGDVVNEEHVNDCQNLQHPCFFESTNSYDVLIFRSVLCEDITWTNTIQTRPIAALIFQGLLITFSDHDRAISRVKKRLESTRKRSLHDPETLLFIILDEVIDNFLDLKGPLLDRYNMWQHELFNAPAKNIEWVSFLNFKAAVRDLRTLSEEQQDVIYQWRQDNEIGISEELNIRYNDLSDHIRRIIRYTTQLENDLDTLIQLHYSLVGNKTNDIMRILTVLSAIFLPLNLVASIFGMNFVNMTIFQKDYGQDIAIFGMAVLGVVLYLLFKRKDWI